MSEVMREGLSWVRVALYRRSEVDPGQAGMMRWERGVKHGRACVCVIASFSLNPRSPCVSGADAVGEGRQVARPSSEASAIGSRELTPALAAEAADLRCLIRAAACGPWSQARHIDHAQTPQRHLRDASVQVPVPAPPVGQVGSANRNRSVRCGIAVVPIYLGRRSNCVAEAKIPQQVICA